MSEAGNTSRDEGESVIDGGRVFEHPCARRVDQCKRIGRGPAVEELELRAGACGRDGKH